MSERILFLSMPESLREKLGQLADRREFSPDPDIPLPVEIAGTGKAAEKAALKDLSFETILSGMLHVLAEGKLRSDWLEYYRRFVLVLRPDILPEFGEVAILKARNGEFDLALQILASLKGLYPESPSVKLNTALVLEQDALMRERHGREDSGPAFLKAALAFEEAMNPPFPEAAYHAGLFFLSRDNFSRSAECLSFFLDSTGAAGSDAEGENPEEDERRKKARVALAEIEAGELEDRQIAEAYALVRDGREEDGMKAVHAFIERKPEVWRGWFILGWALRRLKRWEDAAVAFAKAIELGGTGADVRNELAICLMESGDLKGARRELHAALREDCENTKIISNLGVLALKNGNREEAAGFFRTVLTLEPEDRLAREFLGEGGPGD
ncbi:MAG: tetratricopeptide repeat protein [Treponema sp.]|nr:tetratricopeptide repeat protein [Treponema sp.]